MRVKKVIMVSLIAGWTFCVAAQDLSLGPCREELPFSTRIPVEVGDVGPLEFRPVFGVSRAYFYFTNAGKKPIVRVFMVVELRDGNGGYLFSSLTHAYSKDAFSRSPDLQVFSETQLEKPIQPNEVRLLLAYSPWNSARCPATARATVVKIEYDDGSKSGYSEKDWRREAAVIELGDMDLEASPFVPPFEVMTTIVVDDKGVPSVAQVENPSEEFRVWLQAKVEKWTYLPAVVAGVPVPSELRIFFRFHREASVSYPMPAEVPEEPLYQVIDIAPPEPGKRLVPVVRRP